VAVRGGWERPAQDGRLRPFVCVGGWCGRSGGRAGGVA